MISFPSEWNNRAIWDTNFSYWGTSYLLTMALSIFIQNISIDLGDLCDNGVGNNVNQWNIVKLRVNIMLWNI